MPLLTSQLPDGRQVKVGAERFEAPEVLFQPHLINVEGAGISELLFNVIQSADIDTRSEFYKYVVLSGGSTMYAGLPSRLERELRQLYLERVLKGRAAALHKLKIRIEAPPRRKHMVFLGGAVLANLMRDNDQGFWLTRQDYQELGVAGLMKKLGVKWSVLCCHFFASYILELNCFRHELFLKSADHAVTIISGSKRHYQNFQVIFVIFAWLQKNYSIF